MVPVHGRVCIYVDIHLPHLCRVSTYYCTCMCKRIYVDMHVPYPCRHTSNMHLSIYVPSTCVLTCIHVYICVMTCAACVYNYVWPLAQVHMCARVCVCARMLSLVCAAIPHDRSNVMQKSIHGSGSRKLLQTPSPEAGDALHKTK